MEKEKSRVELCPVCNYDEVYYEPTLHSYFCASHECYSVIQDRNSRALAIVCQNPSCRRIGAPSRTREDGTHTGHICDDCIKLLHGPQEYPSSLMPAYCPKCQSYYGWNECKCRIDFLYGGPIVVCEKCHKQTVWLDSTSGTGFAGGMIYLDTFSCGHNVMDESDDMRAAY